MISKNHLLMSAKNKLSVCAALLLTAMSVAVSAPIPIVDDQFDDGDFTTNTAGVGSGFNSFSYLPSSVSATESANAITMNKSGNGAFARLNLNTKERYDFWQYSGNELVRNQLDITSVSSIGGEGIDMTLRVVGGEAADDSDTHPYNTVLPMLQLQIRGVKSGTDNVFTGSLTVTNRNNELLTGSTNTDGYRILANFDLNDLTQAGNFSMVMDVNGDGYSASITGATISNLSAPMSGLWGDLAQTSSSQDFITDEFNNGSTDPYTSFSIQGKNAGTGQYEADRLQVTVIPEPSSLVLLGLGGLLFVAFGKARSKKS